MKLLTTVILAALAVLEIPTVSATPGSCGVLSVTSCTKAIKSTKTRTLSLTSWCQSVLGCVKSTTTITGDPVTTTTTLSVTETYSYEVLASETFTTTTFTYTETEYTEAARVTFRPTWTVEKFVVVTVTPRAVRRNGVHPKDLLKRATKTTSICASAVQKQACTCLITSCPPPITKDLRKTVKIKETETLYSFVEIPITYTNIDYIPIYTTDVESYTWTETLGILSTHTTTVKCTPSSANPSFYLQATNAPPVDGKYMWIAPVSYPGLGRLLSFSIEPTFTDDLSAATVFSLDADKRLITRHKNGTHYANVDPYNDFQIVHMMTREEIRRRRYINLQCEVRPPSGNYPGGYSELYCLAAGPWSLDVFNYCPIYQEWFNAPLVLAPEWSENFPPCSALVLLIKPVCGGELGTV